MSGWSLGEKLALGVVAVGAAIAVRAAWSVRKVQLPPQLAAPGGAGLVTSRAIAAVDQAATTGAATEALELVTLA